jgi:hypothetical protein
VKYLDQSAVVFTFADEDFVAMVSCPRRELAGNISVCKTEECSFPLGARRNRFCRGGDPGVLFYKAVNPAVDDFWRSGRIKP